MAFSTQTSDSLILEFNPPNTESMFNEDKASKENNKAFAAHIGVVVDTSGSMSADAPIIGASGEKTSSNLNYLDLVKHCVKVICNSLIEDENYILSLVIFSDNAYPVIVSQPINSKTKDDIFERITKMKTSGCTNIWDGIKVITEILHGSEDNLPKKILLFTDGIPNINPTRGIDYELKQIRNNYGIEYPINVLGFGYSLDIDTMTKIATITNGSFSYIPSSSEIMTVMVHQATKIILECYKSLTCLIEYENITTEEINNAAKYLHNHTIEGNVITINVGPICSPITYMVNSKPEHKPKVYYYLTTIEKDQKDYNISGEVAKKKLTDNEIEVIRIRNEFVNNLKIMYHNALTGRFHKNNEIYENCLNLFDIEIINNEITEYEKDLIGEVRMALLIKDNYLKWGKYYIPSLIGCYTKQLCNNFRDPGIQTFLTPSFSRMRDIINEICEQMPPPESSSPALHNSLPNNSGGFMNTIRNTIGGGLMGAAPRAPVRMEAFNSGGCFGGSCLVETPNGFIQMCLIKKGDEVLNSDGSISEVECVVRFESETGYTELCVFDNRLIITPWHPILNENVWKFPNQLLNSQLIKCQYVYNLILKDRKSIYVENVVCCTFGHGIEGDVIGHPFFGTEAVVNNLKNNFTNEYENGSIRSINKVIRDNNMMVCGYK